VRGEIVMGEASPAEGAPLMAPTPQGDAVRNMRTIQG